MSNLLLYPVLAMAPSEPTPPGYMKVAVNDNFESEFMWKSSDVSLDTL